MNRVVVEKRLEYRRSRKGLIMLLLLVVTALLLVVIRERIWVWIVVVRVATLVVVVLRLRLRDEDRSRRVVIQAHDGGEGLRLSERMVVMMVKMRMMMKIN